MTLFVKDSSKTVQARMVIFGLKVNFVLLCRGIENQYSPDYSSLYLSIFLSFRILNNDSLRHKFTTTRQPEIVIFGTQVDVLILPCARILFSFSL